MAFPRIQHVVSHVGSRTVMKSANWANDMTSLWKKCYWLVRFGLAIVQVRGGHSCNTECLTGLFISRKPIGTPTNIARRD